jgi:hypothetical protein
MSGIGFFISVFVVFFLWCNSKATNKSITDKESKKIADRFHFTGFLKGEAVNRMFALSDVFVMPSVSEPFGIVPLEAMRINVPVVISKQSGVSEILQHALKIDFWDVDAMADSIYGLCNYNALSETFKKYGKEEVENLKWENAALNVKKVYEKKHQCLVAVSEGLSNSEGIFLSSSSALKDAFGHFQLGGVSSKLAQIVNNEMRISSRNIELGTTQRSAAHLQSLTDVNEAIQVGRMAVKYALDNKSGVMVTIERVTSSPYEVTYGEKPLSMIANKEKAIPKSMINKAGNFVTDEFIDYVMPLIQGENNPKYYDGVQHFSKMKSGKTDK